MRSSRGIFFLGFRQKLGFRIFTVDSEIYGRSGLILPGPPYCTPTLIFAEYRNKESIDSQNMRIYSNDYSEIYGIVTCVRSMKLFDDYL